MRALQIRATPADLRDLGQVPDLMRNKHTQSLLIVDMIDICFLSNTVLRSLKLGTYFCHYILVCYNCLIIYTSPYIYQQLREEKKRKKFECLHFNELINIY